DRRVAAAGRRHRAAVAGHPADASRPLGGWGVRGVAGRVPHVSTPPVAVQDGAGFVVELEQFSGPLDLLLHLIHEDELDITDLPIAKIADQFLAVISDLGLNQAADYLEMAARLLRIKAQMLLPRRLGDDEWEDPRAELVPRPLDVEGATARLQALLAERAEFGWLEAVGERPTIVDVLSIFIALLELAKRGSLSVHQEGAFTPIQIRRESPREAV